ncbi:hypothetical protein K461DRAFT_107684 [Myriangium duriaei CBS 260.36]|uniref:Membrane anchor Opy2 N-terminal domain-containing protein n=1 Tax=Myriangium duriaei CBS 260.36 TaxID=1168546 RepID=A0A9P4J8J5_9PEZI|nr:hypothetical protein K461DRAFT_107684 [Myriangium duriaei CBS 260.36]
MGTLDAGRSLFKRDCLACPNTTPSCPPCAAGSVCSMIPKSCTQCAQMVCVSQGVTTGTTTASAGPNVGAIAGGVVGGIAFIAIITFAAWWFWIRPKRELEEYDEEWEEEANEHPSELKSQFREQRDARASVHTVHSVASSVLSRASNMIPIAFIPGVTNRDGTTPPVPPIPAARSTDSRGTGSAIFFSPGDLRNSAYSGTSTLDNRSTYFSRNSISPSLARESIASDIYRDDAVANPMPAQQVVMTRPNMVSVKSGSSAPTPSSPASLATTASEGPRLMMPGAGTSNGQFSKPTAVTITKKGAGRFPVRQISDASSAKPSIRSPLSVETDASDDDEEPHARARQSLLRDSVSTYGPFSDTSNLARAGSQYTTTTTLSAVIEEATRRASQVPTHRGLGGSDKRTASPFGDEHKVEEEK